MKTREFSNTLEGIQIDFKKFKDYRMIEKPPKCKEKVEIEATYFAIQIKLQQLRQAAYVPPEGKFDKHIISIKYLRWIKI